MLLFLQRGDPISQRCVGVNESMGKCISEFWRWKKKWFLFFWLKIDTMVSFAGGLINLSVGINALNWCLHFCVWPKIRFKWKWRAHMFESWQMNVLISRRWQPPTWMDSLLSNWKFTCTRSFVLRTSLYFPFISSASGNPIKSQTSSFLLRIRRCIYIYLHALRSTSLVTRNSRSQSKQKMRTKNNITPSFNSFSFVFIRLKWTKTCENYHGITASTQRKVSSSSNAGVYRLEERAESRACKAK